MIGVRRMATVGVTYAGVTAALSRPCPTCGARIGRTCRSLRQRGALTREPVQLKHPHPERRAKRTGERVVNEQPPLFDLPAGTPRPVPKVVAPQQKPVTFSRFKPVTRVLCDDCVRLIHERGVADAPFPISARWRCSTGDRLCDPHKQARHEGGNSVGR